MVHIDSSQPHVIHQLPYLSAGRRGSPPVSGMLDIEVRRATGVGGFAGIVVTGDLQFRSKANDGSPGRLLGEVLAGELSPLSELGELPPTEDMAVILTTKEGRLTLTVEEALALLGISRALPTRPSVGARSPRSAQVGECLSLV